MTVRAYSFQRFLVLVAATIIMIKPIAKPTDTVDLDRIHFSFYSSGWLSDNPISEGVMHTSSPSSQKISSVS